MFKIKYIDSDGKGQNLSKKKKIILFKNRKSAKNYAYNRRADFDRGFIYIVNLDTKEKERYTLL